MSGDYTKFTFQPTKDYSGVLKQQGRVDLDADWNELIEIVDRRWRSETIDIVGHCVVPNTTPDAFLIIPTGSGTFDIGIGRMYVDGMQVENHGLPPADYQADLGELRGALAVPYDDQPYLPAPLPPALSGTPDTTDLVYLDVWQRDVTAIEDPTIREIALGGPDTATRVQSVWQVRVLEDTGDHGCGDDIERWDQAVAPSGGRLTTSAVPPPASDDPCIISPTGGYRGLENRLYRVEIHAVGPIGGGAKFKWSRNNATIASSVSAIPSTTQVTVQQIGRDRVLRFDIGNWIEITDDFREFQGLAGHMAQITAIDEANRVLTFAPAIPGTITFDPTDASRHTRVRRWDQSQNVDASGLLDVAAGPLDIEDGIRVAFALPAGNFKVGDYWVFAARTADGSVEVLQDAPPRGILHHFCRLGFIHWGADLAGTRVTDCRNHWPPAGCDGCCTVTVGDGVDSRGQFTDIQEAINALGNRGGIVCIGRGFYTVRVGLMLDQRNVIIRGMGPATRIFFAPEEDDPRVFLSIQGTELARLEDVFVVAVNADALVRINGSHSCRIRDCVLVNLPVRADDEARVARAIDFVEDCNNCEVVHNALLAAKAVACTNGIVTELLVRDNQALSTQVAVGLRQARGVEVVHNQFRGLGREVFPGDLRLTRDNIDAFQARLAIAFRAAPALANFQAAGVLIYTGNRVVIADNLITAQVGVLAFLLLNARVERNDILSLVGALVIFGIVVKVEDNFVLGLFAGLVHAGVIADLDCTGNEWLGFHGIVWMSLAELARSFGSLLTGALGFVGLGGDATVERTVATGARLAGSLQAFGMVVIAKVHRNVFLTFSRGVYKTDPVISADISIVDNTFSLCSQAGIELGGGGRNPGRLAQLARVVSLRHLVQGNAMAVLGRGISSSTPLTLMEQNSLQCPSIAIEVDASFCTARNNFAVGLVAEAALDSGLITLYSQALSATIAGNQLVNAPGHSILIREDVSDLTIDDNLIQGALRTGIGTRDEIVAVNRARVSRNRVERCQGSVPAGWLQFGGALVISSGQALRIIDNTFANNSPAAGANERPRWFAVYCDDVDGIEISGNAVTDNAAVPGLAGSISLGAIGLRGAQGVIRVQDNVARGNGGLALLIEETSLAPGQVQRALVQNNHFSSGPNQTFTFILALGIDSLLFEGNQCFPEREFAYDALLQMTRGSVCCNSLEKSGWGGMFITGVELVVNANSVRAGGPGLWVSGGGLLPGRVIVTSNLTTGLFASSTGVLVRASNIPAP